MERDITKWIVFQITDENTDKKRFVIAPNHDQNFELGLHESIETDCEVQDVFRTDGRITFTEK